MAGTGGAGRRGGLRFFARFAGSSLVSTLLDQVVAWTLFDVLRGPLAGQDYLRILLSTLVARVCSVALNYTINARLVFDGKGGGQGGDATGEKARLPTRQTLPRFVALAALVLLLSSLGVWVAHTRLGLPEGPSKLVVDFALFFLNYTLQRRWVFRSR